MALWCAGVTGCTGWSSPVACQAAVGLALVGRRSVRTVAPSDHVQAQIDAVRAVVEQERVKQQERYDAAHERATQAALVRLGMNRPGFNGDLVH